MLLKPFLPVFGIAALLSGTMCPAGFAATRTTSLSVTATVAPGCQISRAKTEDTAAKSRTSNWNTPISMSCSLPVAYQIIVSGRPLADHPQSDLVTPGYSHDYDLNLSRAQDRLSNSPADSRNDPVSDGSEIMTVTVIY